MSKANMDIQSLHMQNNAYRDLINALKEQINKYDRLISANEIAIGIQLEAMDQDNKHVPLDYAGFPDYDCTLCLGECDGHL